MINKIAAIFKKQKSQKRKLNLDKTPLGKNKEPNLDVFDDYSQRLPGFPLGIPVIPVELLIERNKEMIKQIILARGLAGAHNKHEVERKVMSPIRHLAEMTHLLPASEKNHFKLVGGLFSFCLEVSLFSIRYAERRILTRATPEIRKEEESLWAHAAFLNGLFSEAITAIAKISVYAEEIGIEWRPGSESLYEWLMNNGLQRYHIRWSETEDRSTVYIMAGKSIQKEQTDIFAAGEKAIYKTLYAALQDQKDHSNPLANIVDTVRYKIMERDEWSYADRYGKPLAGMHLEPWLIDAMRHLVQKKRWLPNDENGRIWHGRDGVFLVWPLAASDMQYELKAAECPFIPNTQEILADILLDAGIIEKNSLGGYLYDIAVPVVESKDKKSLEALKLARYEVLFVKTHHKPIEEDLRIQKEEESASEQDKTEGQEKQSQTSSQGVKNDEFVSNKLASGSDELMINQYDDDYAANYQPPEDHEQVDQNQLRSEASTSTKKLMPNKDEEKINAEQDVESLMGVLLSQSETDTQKNNDTKKKKHSDSHLNPLPEISHLTGKQPQSKNNQTGRLDLILKRLRNLPEEHLSVLPGNLTKVMAKGLKDTHLELNDCIAVLKSAGLIELVDGHETGLSKKGKGTSRYFLIRANLFDGK